MAHWQQILVQRPRVDCPATHLVGAVPAIGHGHGVRRHAAHRHLEAVPAALPCVAKLVARLQRDVEINI